MCTFSVFIGLALLLVDAHVTAAGPQALLHLERLYFYKYDNFCMHGEQHFSCYKKDLLKPNDPEQRLN